MTWQDLRLNERAYWLAVRYGRRVLRWALRIRPLPQDVAYAETLAVVNGLLVRVPSGAVTLKPGEATHVPGLGTIRLNAWGDTATFEHWDH